MSRFVEEHRHNMLFYRQAWRGIRTSQFKYTVLDGRPWHLFDLQEDPYELRNLVHEPSYATLKDELHTWLLDMMRHSKDSFWAG